MTREQYRAQNKDLQTRLYNLNVKKQISEDGLNAKIDELEHKVCDQNSQIRMLQAHIASREEAYQRILEEKVALKNSYDKIFSECEKLQEIVQLLTARINRDSTNSSKPPSSDGFKKVVHNSRVVSDRKPGGQPGHKGHSLVISEKLNEMITSGATEIEVVEHGIPSPVFRSKYEVDINVAVIVKEHRFYDNTVIPEGLNNEVNYGPNLKNMCIYVSVK